METFRTTVELGTRDVAELLGVHSSTVKRWFRGMPEPGAPRTGPHEPSPPPARVETTSGGHRRISLELALRVARARGHEVYLHRFRDHAAEVWRALRALENGEPAPAQDLLIRWLRDRRTHLIGHFLRHVTDGGAADPRILDGVFGGFMRRVGSAWRRGRLRIRDERAASRETTEAVLSLLAVPGGGRGAPASDAPVAVVGTLDADQHVLGAVLVRLLLAQRGWRVEYLGSGLPAVEIVAAQRDLGAELVCISVTPPHGPTDARRFVEVARRLADSHHPFALAVGGGGSRGAEADVRAWPLGPSGRFGSLVAFQSWMDRHFPRPAPAHA